MKKSTKRETQIKPSSMKTIVIILLIIAVLFPVIINGIMFIPYSITSNNLSEKEWLAFWGSYGGGLIGGAGALISVYFTLQYYRQKDIEQQRLFQLTPLLEKMEFLEKQIISREIIKNEHIFGLNITEKTSKEIKEYNRLIAHLKGFFSEQVVGTLIGVFQLENDKGEMFYAHSTLNYFKLPAEIRNYAEIIAELSLYKNCTELLCSDPRLAYIISVEGGGSAGMWPYWWHTRYLDDREDIKQDLETLFSIVEDLISYFNAEHQKKYDLIYNLPNE